MFDLQRSLSIVDFQRSTSNAQLAFGRRGDLRRGRHPTSNVQGHCSGGDSVWLRHQSIRAIYAGIFAKRQLLGRRQSRVQFLRRPNRARRAGASVRGIAHSRARAVRSEAMDESGRLEAAGCDSSCEAQSNSACANRHLRLPANALELLEDRQWIVAEMVAHEQRRLRQYIQGDEAVRRTARVQLAYLLGRHGRWQREHRATRERLFLR